MEAETLDVDCEETFSAQARGDGQGQDETPACQSCRKKKSKCSRHQPCSQCVKSGVECVYEDKRLKGGIKTGVIERLNQRIDTIENMFLGQGVLLQQLLQAKTPGLSTDAGLAVSGPGKIKAYTDRLKKTYSALAPDGVESEEDEGKDSLQRGSAAKRKRSSEPFVAQKRMLAPLQYAPLDMDSLVPPARELEGILETYFKYIHPWVPVLHPSTYLRRVREQDRSLGTATILQAIVAVTTKFMRPLDVADQDRFALNRRAAECRRNVVTTAMENSSIEFTQALILIAFDSIKCGQSRSPWSLVAIVSRKVDELQLNSEDFVERDTFSDFFLNASPALEPAGAWIEVEERRRVFWAAFLMDRFCSIATGVNPSISSKSIQRRLPCDGCMWELDQCVETSFFKIHDQSQNDTAVETAESPFPPAYSTAEGPSGIGGLAYAIEATESLFLVTKFHTRHKLELENSTQLSSWLNRFRQLDSRLLQWELCLTHRWRDVRVVNGYIDPNLTLAHMTHNAAIIVLHRRLAHPPAEARAWLSALVSAASREACIMAAIKIDKIARRYLDASSGTPPHQFMFCLYIAGQILLNHAAHQVARPSDEVGSIIASLHEVSRRLSNDWTDSGEYAHIENPAAKFANSLIEQRDIPSGEAPSAMLTAKTPNPAATFPEPQFSVTFGEMPTMLQHFATSPSSGISLSALNALDPDSTFFGENAMTLTQSLLPSFRVANTRQGDQNTNDENGAQVEREFDFIAELRKMESRSRERDRRVDGQEAANKGG